ncbi:aldehyde ferredoxin oxidoreductase C-terminal domain-containing protein [Tenuifilum thalassicum]|uniref:Aldehyde ferredoxin oxidoreductase n=1 Tax=Tenuifilum thalassicum TaxID=2590900 RepID=A0A7D4CFW1_9BACT|nr:aldehyde ferredoxin oxidoreductase C-terminal domain-containing protein [Tenuifilum thalassicum]QKG79346.1 aldehyde ferredoxin oxidoreductase [Tenuifilum thalassicum]
MSSSNPTIKALMIDAASGFYKVNRYNVGDFFGPVDLGIHLAHKHNSMNIGVGLLAGSIFPGSNRLIVNGISPCWHGFYISSMGGAGLVFDNLGINMFSIVGKASAPSILYLNRIHGEEIEVELLPVRPRTIWAQGRGGVYSMMQYALDNFGNRYETEPRILAAGPASMYTDFGAIASAPIRKGEITYVDTWAGRGGFGSKMVQQHNIVAIIYGGTYVDEDFRDRKVADRWFEDRYQKRLAAKDLEATTKYRFDPKFETGGTFGVNYATMKGDIMAFNYRTIYMTEEERLKIHNDFIVNHYLKQFNEETIKNKQQRTCGEPCGAVCKKMNGKYKKDYEPYQTMGPLCGIFDQRAAEKVNHHADMLGFDAISVGGVLSWLMDCVADGLITPEELGLNEVPVFSTNGFRVVEDSLHNANIAIALLDQMVNPNGAFHLREGARKFARHLARRKGTAVLDKFIYVGFARSGWMVPNQYWTPGVLSPMAIMGKYYMYYGKDFVPPRQLGRENAKRMLNELVMDNLGMCRFHRAWAEDILPEVIEKLYGMKDRFSRSLLLTASRINSRNASIFWESERNIDFVYTFLKKKKEIDGVSNPELDRWISLFEKDKRAAALDFWYEIHKGIHESLLEFH